MYSRNVACRKNQQGMEEDAYQSHLATFANFARLLQGFDDDAVFCTS